MSVAAGLRAARASVKRRNNVRLELDRLHGSRWISDVARLRFGKCRQRQDVLAACKLYLSVVDRHGAVSQSEIPHLMDAGECLGAVYALLTVAHTLPEPLKFCPPVEFEAEEGVRVVVAYIEKKTERGREDFTTIALEALRSKWPCR